MKDIQKGNDQINGIQSIDNRNMKKNEGNMKEALRKMK